MKQSDYINMSPAQRHQYATKTVLMRTDFWRQGDQIDSITYEIFLDWFNFNVNQDEFFTAAQIERYFLEFVCDDGREMVGQFN